jgi:sulfite reductase (NADPH) flavoprotein alpha-component
MFNDVYGTQDKIRPDLHEETYLVKLTENRRLTPKSYDRNVFHMEFDTSESNLKYNLGDALGVHGVNDTEDVKAFIKWYGLNENDVVLVPLGDSGKLESRTVFQVFSQVLDIFGRPSKKFYEALANAATDPKEKEQLLYLVSSEGKDDFKKRVDETVTYEDLLREFTSAKPALEHLVRMISPIKPRHYSIASSQKMHANSVHLLVVAVDWVNSAGKTRFGQCTRYLANLPVGSNVTVSIKPSVMKLPPLDSQPVIMAGLGTGLGKNTKRQKKEGNQ